MKKLFSFIIALCFTIGTFAQNSLSGKITDKDTKEPLLGASISLPDFKRNAVADNNGNYKIDNLPAGKFLLAVKFLGYTSQAFKVEINGETKLDFEMEHSVTEFNAIVVTGVSAATERYSNPVPSRVVSKENLNENSSTNIIDAIAKEPGVSQITTGAGISKPVIRGLGFNRTLVLHNGIRQEGQQWGDEHGVEIDEFSVDRIEIIKGPGSLMYGSDAMAGVINLLSPYPPEEGKIIGNILTNYQTNNNLFGWSAMNAGNLRGVHWLARASQKKAGNYSNKYDGKVFNSGFEELNLNGTVGLSKKWGYSNFHFSSFNQHIGMIEGERDSLGNFIKEVLVNDSTIEEQTVTAADLKGYNLFKPKQSIRHLRLTSENTFVLGKSRLSLHLGFQQNHREEFEVHEEEPGHEGEEEPQLYFLLTTINYGAKYFFPEKKGWETSFGINGMKQKNQNKAEEFLIPEYDLFDIGNFIHTKKTFGKFHLSGGLRYDIRTVDAKELLLDTLEKFKQFKSSFPSISGSAGGSYKFNDKSAFKLNVSRGFRAPNIAELGSNGEHHGTLRYLIGDNNLSPETSLQIDAGVIFNTQHLSVEMGMFNNSIQNYIFSRRINSAAGSDSIVNAEDGDTLSVFKFVQGNTRLYGGEISIDIHPHPLDWLHFENTFSFVAAEQANQPDSTKYLPFIPAPRLQSEIRADFKKAGKLFRRFYVKAEVEYNFEQNRFYSAYETETKTPSYYLLHAAIGSNIVNKNGNTLFSLHLSANNLLDAAYQNHLSRLKYAAENQATGRTGIYNMGRNFSVKLMVPLEFRKKKGE